MSSNDAHYVITFVIGLLSVVFSGTPISSTYKTDRHDITEILLKDRIILSFRKPFLSFYISLLLIWLFIFIFIFYAALESIYTINIWHRHKALLVKIKN